MIGRELYFKFMAKKSAKLVSQDEFKEHFRTGQLIDLRESDVYRASHILGARNLPYSTFKQSYVGLRKDRPVLLYDQSKTMSVRIANFLRKQGYTDIYILKEGFAGWTGKVKHK
ncbi:rhodanese-like domain-containing protein [Vagococcus xieshaowenii]|uniref:Rhodanese-like domain-containing protein n=1 Tax=Vagococcus xieshaowenii TaxID=2562451 RepID=A0AAJ5EG17_9ENTE|nr:rhodanese-like domain-containing protein [Vagococcus xieshaowenii]QCA29579.1 rhodanese-like domain-containing protein [Vagococcus xieshaowenii]TFZ42339.1 rhodanese-like domain-containing protein [Vagococcus xieshaowenii]